MVSAGPRRRTRFTANTDSRAPLHDEFGRSAIEGLLTVTYFSGKRTVTIPVTALPLRPSIKGLNFHLSTAAIAAGTFSG